MVKKIVILLFVFSSILSFGQANRFAGFGSRNTCPVEALKFIDSSGITDQTQKDAICTLVKQLQDSALWTKMVAIYPFIGGTATSNLFNLVNPARTAASFAIAFVGGWTFDSNGALSNGTNAYANTSIFPETNFTKGSIAVSALINGGTLGGADYPVLVGTSDFSCSASNSFHFLFRSNNKYYSPNGQTLPVVSNSTTATTGILIGSVLSTNMYLYLNNSLLSSTTPTTISAYADRSIYISGHNCSLLNLTYQNIRIGFMSFSSGLTAAQCSTLYNIINTYKTTLGR